MKKLFLTLVAVSILSTNTNSQSSICGQFHRKACVVSEENDDPSKEYMYNGQSKSGLFSQGTTSRMRFVVYKGMDYRMNVCAETQIGEAVNFKIYDAKTNEQLYDNAQNEGAKYFEFQCTTSRQLIVEVSIPTGEVAESKGKQADQACVGFLIEHRTTDKVGF